MLRELYIQKWSYCSHDTISVGQQLSSDKFVSVDRWFVDVCRTPNGTRNKWFFHNYLKEYSCAPAIVYVWPLLGSQPTSRVWPAINLSTLKRDERHSSCFRAAKGDFPHSVEHTQIKLIHTSTYSSRTYTADVWLLRSCFGWCQLTVKCYTTSARLL